MSIGFPYLSYSSLLMFGVSQVGRILSDCIFPAWFVALLFMMSGEDCVKVMGSVNLCMRNQV